MIRTIPYLLVVFALVSCKNKNTEGARLYQDHCRHCHQEGGKGVGKLIPPISKTYLHQHADDIACIIRNGMSGKIVVDGVVYDHEMPSNNKLTKFDMVNILNYLEEQHGSGESNKFNVDRVEQSLQKCK